MDFIAISSFLMAIIRYCSCVLSIPKSDGISTVSLWRSILDFCLEWKLIASCLGKLTNKSRPVEMTENTKIQNVDKLKIQVWQIFSAAIDCGDSILVSKHFSAPVLTATTYDFEQKIDKKIHPKHIIFSSSRFTVTFFRWHFSNFAFVRRRKMLSA